MTFEEYFGKPKPAVYNCIIAITDQGEGVLLKSHSDLYDHEIFDGCMLDELVDNVKDIPTEFGLYRCNIEVNSYKCNNPEDPVEWDMTVHLKDVNKLEVNNI